VTDNRPVLIDGFCGEGAASMGYHLAGFRVVGIDLFDQPRYPFEFLKGDAVSSLAALVRIYRPVAVAGSPPCQKRTKLRHRAGGSKFPELVPDWREACLETGLPYVIENTESDLSDEQLGDAALRDPLTLCGSMWDDEMKIDGLLCKRHRLFEANFPLSEPAPCTHKEWDRAGGGFINVHGGGPWREGPRNPDGSRNGHGNKASAPEARQLFDTPWMTRAGMGECVPPRYTRHIGEQLLAHLNLARAVA
jgi:DNA (cytosine-5)-methyltransferase 1